MHTSRISPMVVGGLLAIVVVAALVGYASWRVRPGATGRPLPADQPVLVAVVLPDLDGVQTPRAIAVYTLAKGRGSSEIVDPGETATVPGTSSGVLAGAYLYGGGHLLAGSYGMLKGQTPPEWVVIDQAALLHMGGGREFTFDLPAPIEVFDGTSLFSFAAGTASVDTTSLARLMDGVEYLSGPDRSSVRRQLSDMAIAELARSSAPLQDGVRTSMQPAQLELWLEALSLDETSSVRP